MPATKEIDLLPVKKLIEESEYLLGQARAEEERSEEYALKSHGHADRARLLRKEAASYEAAAQKLVQG